MTNVSVLYQHQCNPSEDQLNEFYRILWYLKREFSSGKNPIVVRLVYYSRQIEVDDRIFPQS